MVYHLQALLWLAAGPTASHTLVATSAPVAIALPRGWSLSPVPEGAKRSLAEIPVKGKSCVSLVSFDYVPTASIDLVKRLMATESLEETDAVSRWNEPHFSDTELAGHPAVLTLFPESDLENRSIYFMENQGGVLVIEACPMGGEQEACQAAYPELVEKLAKSFLAPAVQLRAAALSKAGPAPTPHELPPVPSTLEECFSSLEKHSTPSDLEAFRTGPERAAHFQMGMSIRNAWGLWGNSPLAKSFHAMGVDNPEQMSDIILVSFWRHLNHQPIKLEEQAAWHRHWVAQRTPPAPKLCANGKPAERLFGLTGPRQPDRSARYLHIFGCSAANEYWVWELDAGWSPPSDELRRRIEHVRQSPGVDEAPLEEGTAGTVTRLPNLTPTPNPAPP